MMHLAINKDCFFKANIAMLTEVRLVSMKLKSNTFDAVINIPYLFWNSTVCITTQFLLPNWDSLMTPKRGQRKGKEISSMDLRRQNTKVKTYCFYFNIC